MLLLLLLKMVEQIEEKGEHINRVTLTCNKNNQVALELYHKVGFVETGEEDDEEIELSQRLYQYVTLREMPALKEQATEWFHRKWGLLKMIFMTGKTLLQMFALYIRKKRIVARE